MRIAFLVLFLLVPALLLCIFLVRRAQKAKWRLTLRGLLIFIFVLAAIMAGTIGYRRASMARVSWLDPASQRAKQIFPTAEVVENADGAYEFRYYAKNRNVQRLLPDISNGGYSIGDEYLRVTVRQDKAAAYEVLENIRKADKRPKGAFVIRGRVRDADGEPLENAHIDVMGRFVFINCFGTREDGTFTMALSDENASVPAGSMYYFRVRTRNQTARWNSDYFSLDRNKPEMVVEIAVPGE